MKKPKLQTRFFVAYLAVIMLILGLLTAVFARYTSSLLTQRATDSLSSMLAAQVSRSEAGITEMENVSVTIGYSSLVKNLLTDSFALDMSGSDYQTITQVLIAVNGAEVKVDQIRLYDFYGNMLRVGLLTGVADGDIMASPHYQSILQRDGGKLLTAPYFTDELSVNSMTSDWFISLYRVFRNKYGRAVGVTEVVKRCRPLFLNLRAFEREAEARTVFVYDDSGALIYPYAGGEEAAPAYDYFSMVDAGDGHKTFTPPDGGEGRMLAYTRSAYTGWTYVVSQSLEMTLAPVRQFVRIMLGAMAVFAVLCVFLSYYLSRGLVRPIRQLGRVIRETQLDTLGQPREVNAPFEEFGELTDAFQTMSVELKQSMDEALEARQQEMKSRSLALQSQVNPHFYYNTLASLIVLAERGQTAEVITMCRNLTSIMRYISGTQSQQVPLRQEIDYTDKYLYCMKTRYQDSLIYTIDVDEALMELTVPKLLIQPLVENALKYGTDTLPPWRVSIKSYQDAAGWRIEVVDSGAGFSGEAIALIDKRIADSKEKMGMPNIEINGMGVLNVYTRWMLFCQGDAIFTYDNTPDGHGRVTVGRAAGKNAKTKQAAKEASDNGVEILGGDSRGRGAAATEPGGEGAPAGDGLQGGGPGPNGHPGL